MSDAHKRYYQIAPIRHRVRSYYTGPAAPEEPLEKGRSSAVIARHIEDMVSSDAARLRDIEERIKQRRLKRALESSDQP